MSKTGIFFCRCRGEIANNIDLVAIQDEIQHLVANTSINDALCSADGQNHIKGIIEKKNLDSVVIAACSPTHYETIFRDVMKEAGVNPGKVGFANIRENAAWVHKGTEATNKAFLLSYAKIESIKHSSPFDLKNISAKKSVTVIGGGVAGTRVTSRLVDLGYDVNLVEKSPFLGGNQIHYSKSFPRDECSYCAITPTIAKVHSDPKHVKALTFSEVIEVKGRVGEYSIKINQRPTYVDSDRCTLCGKCQDVCVKEIPDEFNFDLVKRKVIYMPLFDVHPQACFIDDAYADFCVNECSQPCIDVCSSEAINFNDQPKEYVIKTGTIVTAIGYDSYQPKKGEFGYGMSPDVLTLPEYERLLAADGIFNGEIKLLSNKETPPKTVALILCVGSRNREAPYCSIYCCQAAAAAVRQTRHKLPDTKIYVFYRDLIGTGKFGDEYLKMTQQLPNTEWIRNIPEYIEKDNQKYLKINIGGGIVDLPVDMIVLATGMKANADSDQLRVILGLEKTQEGFFREEDILLNPVSTHDMGKFLAGACLGPRTINQTITDADSVVTGVATVIGEGKVKIPVFISEVDDNLCGMCNTCVKTCLFHAASIDEKRMVSVVDESLCRGCGNCVTSCPTGARDLLYYNDAYFRTHLEVFSKFKPANGGKRVIAFLCKSCGYEAADHIGLSGLSYPTGFMIVRTPCTGRIDTQFVLEAFEKGFDGVFIGGCHEDSCAYIGGNYDLERRIDLLNPILASADIQSERIKVVWTSPMEIKRFNEEINGFFTKLDTLL
ncbi:MAG: hydrogenase iron-sulfur subunit [Candidatus Hodarchaeales archaeon]|jgi:heterodisulfide reductase subunit A